MTLYDYSGRAVAYSDDGETIYLFNGAPVAYFYGDMVYGFTGQQLGTIKNGWIRDNKGLCVFLLTMLMEDRLNLSSILSQ